MTAGPVTAVSLILFCVGAYIYDWRLDRAPVLAPSAAPYAPQGLLWLDEEMEQTTWWGDGAVIQSTH